MTISVNEITCRLGGGTVLNKVSFHLTDGEKVAVVGANGSGKTTLLKCIAGMIEPDSGEVAYPKNTSIGYLPQEAIVESHRTLRDELLSVFDDLLSAHTEMRQIEHKLSEIPPDTKEFRKLAHRYDFLQHEVVRRGGYGLDSEVGRVAAGLGFSTQDLDRLCHLFSGGWQMRILLAKLILQQPHILLLDEPTNHLDLESILWFEEWVRNSKSDVLMVSHERAFMDRLASRIFELHNGTLSIYKGNYTSYLNQRKARHEQMRRAYENQRQQINQMRRFIEKNRADKSRAAQVQSRIKQLKKIKILPLPPSDKVIHFSFPQPARGNKLALALENCQKRYGSKQVLKLFSLKIYRGDRIALVGLNGAGKSTLMRLLAGVEPPTSGERHIGSQILLEFFSQYQDDDLNPESTVIDAVLERAPLDVSAQARNLLGAFLFSGDDVFKKVGVLSGGEKTRLRLARMLFSRANFLLLDEPTNHLDVASRATLERALLQYTGTLVFVSHDRVFMDRIANKVLEIHQGNIKAYPGNFTDYVHAYVRAKEKEREITDGTINSAPFRLSGGDIIYTGRIEGVGGREMNVSAQTSSPRKKTREEKRREAQRRNELSRKKYPLEVEIRKLEKSIQSAEARLAEIDALLQKPDVYTDAARCAELLKEKKSLENKLESELTRWEQKHRRLEKLLRKFRI